MTPHPRPMLEESHWLPDTSEALLETTLGELLRDLANAVPDRTAFVEAATDVSKRRRWTYRQLLADAEMVATALLHHHHPGDRVAVWAPNCAEWVILQHGAS